MTARNHWFAFRVYHNTAKKFIFKLQADCQQYYQAERVTQSIDLSYTKTVTRKILFPSIVFVRSTLEYVEAIHRDPFSDASLYTYPGTKEPAIISDAEMETFMFVLSTGSEQLDIVDEKLAKGDRVKVLDGVFKGCEGYIVRIKGDRRFVVSLQGVVAVATSYIPQKFLQKI